MGHNMRQIASEKITETIAKLFKQANYFLPEDVFKALGNAYAVEKSVNGKWALDQIVKNAKIAGQKDMPLCQDTGSAEVFIKIGQEVSITGLDLESAVNEGVRKGYEEGYLRKSIVADPLDRKNTGTNTPAKLYTEMVPGNRIEITVLPKGGGSENASSLEMLSPSAGIEGVKKFVVESVRKKGGNACPPLVVGVGIGGGFSSVALLAKKALLRELGKRNESIFYDKIEKEILDEINTLDIGPIGLGGKVTALAVLIEHAPCHIASLPVAVNMQCHSCRRMKDIL